MPGQPLVIGVDIGTQSTQAAPVSDDGRWLAQHAEAYPVDMPRPLWRATPDPTRRDAYASVHEQYVAAYPALAGVMHGLAGTGSS